MKPFKRIKGKKEEKKKRTKDI
jgi:hypothetical protein